MAEKNDKNWVSESKTARYTTVSQKDTEPMGITFKEIDGDCSICPLHKAGICNGMANYGNESVYPPCSELDEEIDAEVYLQKLQEAARYREERRKEKQKAEAEKERKKAIKKRRRQFSDAYCRTEIEQVTYLKKSVKATEKAIERQTSDLAFAEAMTKSGIPMGDLIAMESQLDNFCSQLMVNKSLLHDAEKRLAAQRVKAQETEQYKAIK